MANLSAYLSLFTLVLVTMSSCNEVQKLPVNPDYSVELSKTFGKMHDIHFTAELKTTLNCSQVPNDEVRFIFSDNSPQPKVQTVIAKSPKVNFVAKSDQYADMGFSHVMNVQVFMGKDLIATESMKFKFPKKEY